MYGHGEVRKGLAGTTVTDAASGNGSSPLKRKKRPRTVLLYERHNMLAKGSLGSHWPYENCETVGEGDRLRRNRGRCIVCVCFGAPNSRSTVTCSGCDGVFLCIAPRWDDPTGQQQRVSCFQVYHTSNDPRLTPPQVLEAAEEREAAASLQRDAGASANQAASQSNAPGSTAGDTSASAASSGAAGAMSSSSAATETAPSLAEGRGVNVADSTDSGVAKRQRRE